MKMPLAAAALLLGAAPALAAPVAPPTPGAGDSIARLRAQNAALRERMGQMQLDLLIADVIARREPGAAPATAREAGAAMQVVAFRR